MDLNKKILLSNKLKKNFSSLTKTVGYISGWETETEIFCTGATGNPDHLISGLQVIGFYCVLNETADAENEYKSICDQNFSSLKIELESLVVLFISKGNDDIRAKSYSPYYGTFNDICIEDLTYNPAILIRAKGEIPLILEITSDPETLRENIELGIERLRTTFQSQVAAFCLRNSNFILHSNQDYSSDSSLKCKDLIKMMSEQETEKSKHKKNTQRKLPLELDLLIQISGDAALENTFNHSVVIHCQRREFQCASVSLPIDVIAATLESTSISSLHKLLQSAVDEQLVKFSQCLLKYSKRLDIVSPAPYHFYAEDWEFPITLIYPLEKSDKDLEKHRKALHEELLLPLDKPFIKKLNACEFSLTSSSGHLLNPHESINTSSVTGGTPSLVQGRYSYHHYMQDHMNDNGWGCAYRSLQTIISWFKYQGYTDRNIPTHTEIQEALVAVGDKPQSFVGSKKWIGSQEVSFCLDHLIKVQSKIMFVSSGAELANKGRELFNHFRDQGTPIMIGGGVLAHTILGVDFNEDTGDLKFLILDPHYTGSEDLSIILSKGWCGWKGIQFWDQNAFYNLCLPQRPKEI